MTKKIEDGVTLRSWNFELGAGNNVSKGMAMGVFSNGGNNFCYAESGINEDTGEREKVFVVNTKELEKQGFRLIIR